MRGLKVYVLFCIALVSFLFCFWYSSSTSYLDIPVERRELYLESEQRIVETFHASLTETVEDWRQEDPCSDSAAENILFSKLEGRFYCFVSHSQDYSSRFPVFNTLVKRNPRISITPTSYEDISLALAIARALNLVVTVRNGGHNPAGFSIHDGGMVIDMAFFRKVSFVSESEDADWMKYDDKYVIAQGGALWSDVHRRLRERYRQNDFLSIVGGGCPSVGVVGLALGGGIGWPSRHRGLVSDNMLAAKIIFPNGTLAVIDEERHPDLMWALRGAGGSNFGVVTEVLLRTFPAEERYFAGSFSFMRNPVDAEDLLQVHADHVLNGDLDPRFTVDFMFALVFEKTTQSMLHMSLSLFFDGPIEEAKNASQPLLDAFSEQINIADACRVNKKMCDSSHNSLEARSKTVEWFKAGGPYLQNHTFSSWSSYYGMGKTDIYWTSGVFDEWTPQATSNLLKPFKSPGVVQLHDGIRAQAQVIIEHLGGAIGRGPSLWKHKKGIGLISVQTMLQNLMKDNKDIQDQYPIHTRQMKAWIDRFYRRMAPHFTGSYANYAYEEMENWQEKYYGVEFYNKLVKIKNSISGSKMFSSLQRIESTPIMVNHSETLSASEIMDDHHLDRDSFEADSSFLCPDWLVDHALSVTPRDVFPINSNSHTWKGPNLQKKQDTEGQKTILLTGGSDGIGFSAIINFLSLGVNVITTSQSEAKCHDTEAKIFALLHHASFSSSISVYGGLICFPLVLDDLESVEMFVKRVQDFLGGSQLDVIVLNVGHNGMPGIASNAGGLSKSLVVNHLGHFYLTLLLIQDQLLNVSGRVIIQGSHAAIIATENEIVSFLETSEQTNGQVIGNPNINQNSLYQAVEFRTYAAGKALNAIFALEFHRRIQQSMHLRDLHVFLSLPQGTAETKLSEPYLHNSQYKEEILEQSTMISSAEAALPCVYASMEQLDQFNILLMESNFTRKVMWEYKKPPMGVQYVAGCQVGSVAAHFRFVDWLKTTTTCRLWNWSVETLNTLRNGTLHTEQGPLAEFALMSCNPL